MIRLKYAIAAIVLLGIEVLIALFVHDAFIRPYFGDVLVVVVIYAFVRIIVPNKCALLPLWIFIFAAGTEISQYFHFVELLGLGNIKFFRVLMGSVFDVKDVICYAVGCVFLGVYEIVRKKKKN